MTPKLLPIQVKMSKKIDLSETLDPSVWVSEWMEAITLNPSIPTDQDAMLSWFSSAIMVGSNLSNKKFDK
jgi:tRNA U34 5-methylaminomethyl-2-thiouridine-forming methyltransferase MnmC